MTRLHKGAHDGGGSQPFDQQVGGHVVARRDHLLSGLAYGHLRARRQVGESGRADLLGFVGDRELVGPVHGSGLDGIRNRKQHI